MSATSNRNGPTYAADFLSLPGRPARPRQVGITHVLDKGMCSSEIEGLFEVADGLVDVVKLGWGTGYAVRNLRKKLEIYERAGVPVVLGGTFWEACFAQGKTDEYRRFVEDLGLTHVEVSDGTISIPHDRKLEAISELAQDFTVINITPEQIVVRQAQTDLLHWTPPPPKMEGPPPELDPKSPGKTPDWIEETILPPTK